MLCDGEHYAESATRRYHSAAQLVSPSQSQIPSTQVLPLSPTRSGLIITDKRRPVISLPHHASSSLSDDATTSHPYITSQDVYQRVYEFLHSKDLDSDSYLTLSPITVEEFKEFQSKFEAKHPSHWDRIRWVLGFTLLEQ